MLGKGIAVGLGTDGEKENNNLDMFEEQKQHRFSPNIAARMLLLLTHGLFVAWQQSMEPALWEWKIT